MIDLEGRSIKLLPNQGFTMPKVVLHCTRAPERSVILMVEAAAIVPTGDARSSRSSGRYRACRLALNDKWHRDAN